MTTYKNKNFVKRDYECTNVVFCQADKPMPDNWAQCNPEEIEQRNCTQLYIENDVRYFGYL